MTKEGATSRAGSHAYRVDPRKAPQQLRCHAVGGVHFFSHGRLYIEQFGRYQHRYEGGSQARNDEVEASAQFHWQMLQLAGPARAHPSRLMKIMRAVS